MEDLDLGKNVNTALRDVPKSVLVKDVTKTNADAEEYKRTHGRYGHCWKLAGFFWKRKLLVIKK